MTPMVTFICKNCGKIIVGWPSSNRKFCTKKCQHEYQHGENAAHWKGGRFLRGKYIRTYEPTCPDHRIFEHRIVAEAKLGRPLREDEICHHLNGDGTDNRPENIAVVSRADHVRIHLPRKGTGKTGLELAHERLKKYTLPAKRSI